MPRIFDFRVFGRIARAITWHSDPNLARIDARLDRIERAIFNLKGTIMNNLEALNAKLDELKAKADESAATLSGLAKAVVDLKDATDQQAAIDALTEKAQGILDTLTTAEDAADDQLPTS